MIHTDSSYMSSILSTDAVIKPETTRDILILIQQQYFQLAAKTAYTADESNREKI